MTRDSGNGPCDLKWDGRERQNKLCFTLSRSRPNRSGLLAAADPSGCRGQTKSPEANEEVVCGLRFLFGVSSIGIRLKNLGRGAIPTLYFSQNQNKYLETFKNTVTL